MRMNTNLSPLSMFGTWDLSADEGHEVAKRIRAGNSQNFGDFLASSGRWNVPEAVRAKINSNIMALLDDGQAVTWERATSGVDVAQITPAGKAGKIAKKPQGDDARDEGALNMLLKLFDKKDVSMLPLPALLASVSQGILSTDRAMDAIMQRIQRQKAAGTFPEHPSDFAQAVNAATGGMETVEGLGFTAAQVKAINDMAGFDPAYDGDGQKHDENHPIHPQNDLGKAIMTIANHDYQLPSLQKPIADVVREMRKSYPAAAFDTLDNDDTAPGLERRQVGG